MSGRVDAHRGERVVPFLVAFVVVMLSGHDGLNSFRSVPVLTVCLAAVGLHYRLHGVRVVPTVSLSGVTFLLWCGTSITWSDNHFLSIVQTTATVLTAVLASILVQRVGLENLLRGASIAGLFILTESLFSAVLPGHPGLSPGDLYQPYSLQGLYGNRNLLSEVLTLTFTATICIPARTRSMRFGVTLLAAALFAGVVATRSSTGLVSSIFALVIVLALRMIVGRREKSRGPLLIVIGVFSVLGVGWVLANQSLVFAALDRDATFTGRTVIWNAVQFVIGERPWVGFGWGAPWAEGSRAADVTRRAAHFIVPNAHSGYLDTLLQIGIVGLILSCIVLAVVLALGARAVVVHGNRPAVFLTVLPLLLLVYNFDEPIGLTTLSIFLVSAAVAGTSGVWRQPPVEPRQEWEILHHAQTRLVNGSYVLRISSTTSNNQVGGRGSPSA